MGCEGRYLRLKKILWFRGAEWTSLSQRNLLAQASKDARLIQEERAHPDIPAELLHGLT